VTNQLNCIPLATYVQVKTVPDRIKLRHHSAVVAASSMAGTWSAHHGLDKRVAFAGVRSCDELRLQHFTVRSSIQVGDLKEVKASNSRRAARAAGFLHMGLVEAAYRKELQAAFVDCLRRKSGSDYAEKEKKLSFEDLSMRHPEFAGWVLKVEPMFRLVVRPQPFEGKSHVKSVQIATMRIEDARDIEAAVDMHDSIPVAY
jgi:hypothetical protein